MIDHDEARELRQQDAHDHRNERQHLAHPDPRDPDYHGATAPQRMLIGGRQAGKTETLRKMTAANKVALAAMMRQSGGR